MKKLVLSIMMGFMLFTPIVAVTTIPVAAETTFRSDACQGLQQINPGASCSDDGVAAQSKIAKIVSKVVQILSVIVGIVAVIMIIVGGFKFITAGGESSKVASARNTIVYALIGLLVVALAEVIVKVVLNQT